ncbi:testis-specific serine/threonine-protein kinase 6-like [Ptychodera flava]|uniref:testis-specific serine/threonine-protein kinase 6-like n=1 Tax=Ptychodera flava TaxID=63121 RepID=UPI00396A6C36
MAQHVLSQTVIEHATKQSECVGKEFYFDSLKISSQKVSPTSTNGKLTTDHDMANVVKNIRQSFSDDEFASLLGLPFIDRRSLKFGEVVDEGPLCKVHIVTRSNDEMSVRVMDRKLLEHEGAILGVLPGCDSFPVLHGITSLDDNNYGIVQDMTYGEDMEMMRFNGDLEQFSLDQKLQLASQLCAAVAHMHSVGIVHQNICPQSIIINKKTLKVSLRDFTNAEKLYDAGKSRGLGELPYMAPEAILDRGETSFKEDIWSLGLVLALLFTGRKPYNSELFGLEDFMDLHIANQNRPRYAQKRPTSVDLKRYQGQGTLIEQVGMLINLSVCSTPELRPSAKYLSAAFTMFQSAAEA